MTPSLPTSYLTLVISNPSQLLHGYLPIRCFDRNGGYIGSQADDWRLSDRTDSVHPCHCRIHWSDGSFCVTDQCGQTYANAHDLPLGRGTTVRLKEGDFLQIGDYRVVAHLQSHDMADNDPRHYGQRSLSELFTEGGDHLEDWPAETPTLLPTPDPQQCACSEFEQLCRPLDSAEEHDPLLELLPSPPEPDVLDLLENNRARTRVIGQTAPDQAVCQDLARVFLRLRCTLLLLTCLALPGCTMLGKIGQVIWTPSIPVGGPDDQPSQYSLSLYADDNVNLRLIVPGIDSAEDSTYSPYAVSVQAASPQSLTEKLQAVLNHFYETAPAQSPMVSETGVSLQMSPVDAMLLGDYEAPGVSLSAPERHAGPRTIASPIPFKVLQLSDDSLLLNASAQALAEDLKKTLGSTYIRVDDYRLQPGQFKFVDLQPLDESTRFVAVIADYHSTDASQWKQLLRVEPKGRRYALLIHLDNAQVELKGETR
ncbi:type VI secretion system lipoprotein TssJ [Pseudomonas gingeri]